VVPFCLYHVSIADIPGLELFSGIAELVIASSRWARIEGIEGIEGRVPEFEVATPESFQKLPKHPIESDLSR